MNVSGGKASGQPNSSVFEMEDAYPGQKRIYVDNPIRRPSEVDGGNAIGGNGTPSAKEDDEIPRPSNFSGVDISPHITADVSTEQLVFTKFPTYR